MYRQFARTLCLGAIAVVAGCGEAPQAPSEAPAPVQHRISFTAVAEPAAGRFQIVAGPLATLGLMTQDSNGNPATADSGKVQLYGATVSFASGGVGYPSGCLTTSPQVMFSDVELRTGFNEQLRNVYVKITSVSGGQTFCGTKAAVGTFAASLNPNVWLYLYAPLDNGNTANFSLPNRSLKWGLQLPDNSAFWFNGEIWAELFPAPPTFSAPADGFTFYTGDATAQAAFAWKDDQTANGSTPVAGQPPLPTSVGSEITIRKCNTVASGAFNAAACTTVVAGPTVTASRQYKTSLTVGNWYQWSLRPAFTLPGLTATTIGTQVVSRSFKTSK
jgi:hypothetical protein